MPRFPLVQFWYTRMDNPYLAFEHRHNMVAFEACRMLGIPYSTYMRSRKHCIIRTETQYHIDALNALPPEEFRRLRAERGEV